MLPTKNCELTFMFLFSLTVFLLSITSSNYRTVKSVVWELVYLRLKEKLCSFGI